MKKTPKTRLARTTATSQLDTAKLAAVAGGTGDAWGDRVSPSMWDRISDSTWGRVADDGSTAESDATYNRV